MVAPAAKVGFARQFSTPGGRHNLPALLALLLGVAVLLSGAVAIFLPFAAPIVLALVLTTASYPIFNWILLRIGEKRRGLASGLTCAFIVLAVFVPLGWITYSIVSEAPSKDELERAVSDFKDYLTKNETLRGWWSWLEKSWQQLSSAAGSSEGGDVSETTSSLVKTVVGGTAAILKAIVTSILSNTVQIFLGFFLMPVILFFFLKDGPIILQAVMRQVPLEKSYQEKLVSTFAQVSRSIIRGSIGTAFFQGAIASVAYAVVGVSAIFWGGVTAFCALIPVVGTTIVTVPLAVYLYFKASLWQCIVVSVMALVVGMLDSFLKPMLMMGTLRVHSLWLMLSILGGVSAFGPMGLLYGPMVLTLLGTFLALLVREEEAEAVRSQGASANSGAQDVHPAEPATAAVQSPDVSRAAGGAP